MENDNNQNKKLSSWWGRCGCNTRRGSIGWGVFFLVLGVYFLAKEVGYITSNISVWTIALVAFGLYLILRGVTK